MLKNTSSLSLFEQINKGADPLIDVWILSNTPLTLLFFSLLYYISIKYGTQIMEKRKPFVIKNTIISYNFIQALFSAWLSYQAFRIDISYGVVFGNLCKPTELPTREFYEKVWSVVWWYHFAKLVDLLDTIFFILRKKGEQLTFLHVYHHISTYFMSFIYIKYMPGAQGLFGIFLNSLVHVIMYTYYLLTAMGPKYRKYLWWKKHVTKIQIIQLATFTIYFTLIFIWDCNYPKIMSGIFLFQAFTILLLFANFYIKSYSLKRQNNQMSNINKPIKSE